jgi:hypothetical protein
MLHKRRQIDRHTCRNGRKWEEMGGNGRKRGGLDEKRRERSFGDSLASPAKTSTYGRNTEKIVVLGVSNGQCQGKAEREQGAENARKQPCSPDDHHHSRDRRSELLTTRNACATCK